LWSSRARLRLDASREHDEHLLVAAIDEALEWAHIVKQPGVQNRLAIIDGEENIAPDDDKATILEAV